MAEISGSQGERQDDLGGAVQRTQGGINESLEGAVVGKRPINLQGRLRFIKEI